MCHLELAKRGEIFANVELLPAFSDSQSLRASYFYFARAKKSNQKKARPLIATYISDLIWQKPVVPIHSLFIVTQISSMIFDRLLLATMSEHGFRERKAALPPGPGGYMCRDSIDLRKKLGEYGITIGLGAGFHGTPASTLLYVFCMSRIYFPLLMLFAGCSSVNDVEYLSDQELSWFQAVEFINRQPEKIENVWQSHSLLVNLELRSGVILKTKEPHIDEVFAVLKKCGMSCNHIGWITE